MPHAVIVEMQLPKHIHLPKLERRPELDALRGLFLVWMTITHLPTRFSDFVNQPLGFVSSAEGFVFISALLIGRLYIRDLVQDPGNRLATREAQRKRLERQRRTAARVMPNAEDKPRRELARTGT